MSIKNIPVVLVPGKHLEFQGAMRKGMREGKGSERDQQDGVKQGHYIE